jgi:hypothetical protein
MADHTGDAGAADTGSIARIWRNDQHTPAHRQCGESIIDGLAAVCAPLICRRRVVLSGCHAAAEDLARIQGDAVEEQERRRRNGSAQCGAEQLFKGQPGQTHRDGGQHDQPG